jgi:DNA polymerase-3 subunit epsilon
MARPAIQDCNILFLDFETGGLSARDHDIVEAAYVLTDPTGKTVLSEWSSKVLPVRPVEPAAARVNGYSAEKWASANAVPLDTAMVHILGAARDSMLACHNVPFDKSFLEAAMYARAQRWPGSYHSIDTCSLAVPLLRNGLVQNVKLTTLTSYFNIEHGEAHSALSDARACRQVFLRLMEIYGPGLKKLAEAAGLSLSEKET